MVDNFQSGDFSVDDNLIMIAIDSVVEEMPSDQQKRMREKMKREFDADRYNGIHAMIYRKVDENLGTEISKLRAVK